MEEIPKTFLEAFKQHKRASEIISKNGYTIVVRFTDGKTGMLDLRDVLPPSTLSEVSAHHATVVDGVIQWPSVGKVLDDENGELRLYPYDIDPVTAWMNTKF